MRPLSVQFLNRVYPPAAGATGQLLAELAPELVRLGWQVTVVTSRPSRDVPRSEVVEGVRVERVDAPAFSRTSLWRRALGYLALYPGLLRRALAVPRADVVVTMTDPPLLALLGPALRRLRGSRLVHWAQDLYPEVAEALGVLRRGGWLAECCRAASTWASRRHDAVVAVGRCMKERLQARGLPPDRLHVIPNWAPSTVLSCDPAAGQVFRHQHGLEDRFVVMYSGNLGLAHPFEAVLDAAELLRDIRPQIGFVVIGAGPRLDWVQTQAQARRLTNIEFLPPQPWEALAESLSAADLHLATMHPALAGLVVPSKVYGALGVGRPCLFLGPVESEVAHLIQQFDCGEVLPGAGGAALAERIMAWMADPARRQAASWRARAAAQAHSLPTAVEAFHRLLRQVLPHCAEPVEFGRRGSQTKRAAAAGVDPLSGTPGTSSAERRM